MKSKRLTLRLLLAGLVVLPLMSHGSCVVDRFGPGDFFDTGFFGGGFDYFVDDYYYDDYYYDDAYYEGDVFFYFF